MNVRWSLPHHRNQSISPAQSQSDCVHSWSSPIRILSQSTLIRWTRIQSKCLDFDLQCERNRSGLRLHLDWINPPNQGGLRKDSTRPSVNAISLYRSVNQTDFGLDIPVLSQSKSYPVHYCERTLNPLQIQSDFLQIEI